MLSLFQFFPIKFFQEVNNFNACGKVATRLNDFGWVSEFGWMIDTKSYSFEGQMKKVAQWCGGYK
jgi:hypothetical protein